MRKASLLLLVLWAVQAFGVTLPPLKIEQYTLPNGLMVCLYEDHSTPIVGVNINYFVGSKNEKRGRTGFAHLFEHMMFQGSKNFNDDYFKALESVGAFVNGATSQDRTRYLEIVPSNYLERALWLESDRMGFLPDAMTEDRLKNQISVVQMEDVALYNLPLDTLNRECAALQKVTIADLQKAARKYFMDAKPQVVVVGDKTKVLDKVKALNAGDLVFCDKLGNIIDAK
jgi:predicted Zn-dependent peptidase